MTAHILVVDDDPDAREVLDIILKTLEILIVEAKNGEEALAMLREDLPLLLILDLSMPQIDGYQVLREIHSNEATASLPVIVFTAHEVTNELAQTLHVAKSRIMRKGDVSMTRLRDLVVDILRDELDVNLELLPSTQ